MTLVTFRWHHLGCDGFLMTFRQHHLGDDYLLMTFRNKTNRKQISCNYCFPYTKVHIDAAASPITATVIEPIATCGFADSASDLNWYGFLVQMPAVPSRKPPQSSDATFKALRKHIFVAVLEMNSLWTCGLGNIIDDDGGACGGGACNRLILDTFLSVSHTAVWSVDYLSCLPLLLTSSTFSLAFADMCANITVALAPIKNGYNGRSCCCGYCGCRCK